MTPKLTRGRRVSGRVSALTAVAAASLMLCAGAAQAQNAGDPFGSFQHDSAQPIEITADKLAVNNAARTATFTGEVVAGQGRLRLTADKITVNYGGDAAQAAGGQGGSNAGGSAGGQGGAIERLRAEGSVFLSSGEETARGDWADYDVEKGVVTMGGQVVLTQGENAISGENLRINLNAGTGEIFGGRVQSVFTPPKKGD